MTAVLLPISDRPTIDPRPDTGATPRARRFRPDVEGLRALAVLAVVLHHARLGVPGGYLGVDVFLVISGFLITGHFADASVREGGAPVVLSGRLARVLPVAGVVVAATFAAAQLLGASPRVTSAAFDQVGPLLIGSTFWLATAAGLALVHTLPRRLQAALRALLLAGVTAASYCVYALAHTEPSTWNLVSIKSRAWEFALGGLVAVASPILARLPRAVAELLAAIGLVSLIGSFFATLGPDALILGAVGGTALVLAAGLDRPRRVERMLGEALMQCIGRVAYSWFLWSWPMLVLAPLAVGHPMTGAQRGVVVWLSLLVAVASYFALEARARRAGRGERPC
jgi:peptidoglycan/LPS O-acetylase OafA/YrhL